MPKINHPSIPLSRPSIGSAEIQAVAAVLRSGWVAHGPKNKEFEDLLKDYFGVKEAVVVNSGASALFLALRALDIAGEVIVPSFTMSASANAIVSAGARPVFAEIEEATGNLDPQKLEEKITSRTQAIMPVHFAGQSCKMDQILTIARRHKLMIIEDSAEAIGARYKGQLAGTFGDAGCLSFWASKNITTGEGGAVLTNKKKIADRVRMLMAHGIPTTTLEREKARKPWYRDSIAAGFNMRMSNINAAIGVVQIKKIDELNARRKKLAAYLTDKLSSVSGLRPLALLPECDHVYQMYVVQLLGFSARDPLVHRLRARGVGASVHFDPPVHKQTFYQKQYGSVSLPVTERLSSRVVTLPLFPGMSFRDLDYVARMIKEEVAAL